MSVNYCAGRLAAGWHASSKPPNGPPARENGALLWGPKLPTTKEIVIWASHTSFAASRMRLAAPSDQVRVWTDSLLAVDEFYLIY